MGGIGKFLSRAWRVVAVLWGLGGIFLIFWGPESWYPGQLATAIPAFVVAGLSLESAVIAWHERRWLLAVFGGVGGLLSAAAIMVALTGPLANASYVLIPGMICMLVAVVGNVAADNNHSGGSSPR